MYHKNEEFRRKGKDLRANQARYNKIRDGAWYTLHKLTPALNGHRVFFFHNSH